MNQSPHQLDSCVGLWGIWRRSAAGGQSESSVHRSGRHSVATLKFRNGGLGAIVTSLSQKPGLFTKVRVHGSNGASIGVETDRGATFIAGVSQIAEPPLNDLWTIPGEEHLLAEFQATDRARFQAIDPIAHYHSLQIQDFLQGIRAGRPPLVTGEDGRAVVEIFSAIYESNKNGSAVSLPLRES